MPDPLIIADPELMHSDGRTFWTTPEMDQPHFFVAEVAKCFFGMSARWVRHHLHIDYEDSTGVVFEVPRSEKDFRIFRLYDIERWAHILAQHHVIDGRRLELVIRAVKNTAQLHNHLA